MANTKISQEVIARYFKLVKKLVDTGEYRSVNSFAVSNGFNRINFHKAYAGNGNFQLEWIAVLHKKHEASLEYIFTGKGKEFN